MVNKIISAKMLIVVLTIFSFSIRSYSQSIDEVTLTVSGDGESKKEATDIALRSAIEQAFGVFVSANTSILNDSLVKDEIATVSSGNIKKYEEIASFLLPNGKNTVTLKATVSISQLGKYAESHGSSVEFAGMTFGANMKLKELNKINEEKSIENLITQIKALAPSMFDYKLEMGEPKMSNDQESYIIGIELFVNYNTNTDIVNNLILNTLSSLSLKPQDVNEYKTSNINTYPITIGNFHTLYTPIVVKFKETPSIQTEAKSIIADFDFNDISSPESSFKSSIAPLYFRSVNTGEKMADLVNIILSYGIFNFVIQDNTGQESFIDRSFITSDNQYDYSHIVYKGLFSYQYKQKLIIGFDDSYHDWYYDNSDMQKGGFRYNKSIYHEIVLPHFFKDKLAMKNGIIGCYVLNLDLTIPKDDISKYSKFTIGRKSSTL